MSSFCVYSGSFHILLPQEHSPHPAALEAELAMRLLPQVRGTVCDERGVYTLHEAESWIHLVSKMMLMYQLKWWTRKETVQGLVRFMLNLTSPMLETLTTEAGQDPVTRCVELGGEESGWGEEKVEVLCLLSMCQRAIDIRVLRDSTLEQLERLHPISREGLVNRQEQVLPCCLVLARGGWLLGVPVPP